jgi:hypothetical protein
MTLDLLLVHLIRSVPPASHQLSSVVHAGPRELNFTPPSRVTWNMYNANPVHRLHTPVPDPLEDDEEPGVRQPPALPDEDSDVIPQRDPPNPGESPMIAAPVLYSS